MIIAFLGPPGSGKGTQAKQLTDRLGFYHFDTGSMLRREADSGSELGQRIASFINAGNLVPLEVIRELVLKFLSETTAARIMFDGFPRNVDQAKVLDEGLEQSGRELTCVVYLEMDTQTLQERIVNRRTCEICGKIYNLRTNKPEFDERCDLDGGKLIQRADDTPETFQRRLEVYIAQTVPVLEHYREMDKLCVVNADQSIEQVTADIQGQLGFNRGAA